MPAKPSNDAPPALSASMYVILLALMPGDRHGYAIMQSVEEITRGETRLGPATLYTNIRKLLELGMLEETGDRPDPDLDDERRRYYRLTGLGREAVAAETRRLGRLVRYANAHSLLGA